MSSPYYKIVPLEVSIPDKYQRLHGLVTDLSTSISPMVEETLSRSQMLSIPLGSVVNLLKLLTRTIPDPDIEPEKKWHLLGSIFSKYVKNWREMNDSIKYPPPLPGSRAAQELTEPLVLRKMLQSIFSEFRELVSDRIETDRLAEKELCLGALESKLTVASSSGIARGL